MRLALSVSDTSSNCFIATRILACVICCLLSSHQSHAQTRTGIVKGIIQDETGAAIPNAKLVFRTRNDAVIAEGVSNADGEFVIAVPSSKALALAVTAPGFAAFTTTLDTTGSIASDLKIVLAPAPLSERVTVTATRTETRLGDTAASVATLTRRDLLITSAITLDDTLRQVPGFSLFRRSGSRTANPTSQGVSLRGVGASGASRAVVLEDGVPLNDPFGGWVYWSRVPRTSIESVEVLSGGASHLYGTGALGGVINISKRQPRDSALDLELSYGNEKTADGSLYAGGRRGRWGASLAAQSFRTDGYIIVDPRDRGVVDVPANSRSATIDLRIERSISTYGDIFANASFFGESRSNGTPLQTNRTHIRRFVLGGDLETSETGRFTVRGYGGTQIFDQSFSAVSTTRTTEALTRLQRVPAQSIGISAQWSRPFAKRQTLVAGVEAHEVRGASDEIAYVAGRPTSSIDAGGRERALGIFAEDIIRLGASVFVTAGARFDRWRNYDAQSRTRPIASTAATTSTIFTDRTETAFSPHLSLLYKPVNYLGVYLSASRAFRAPTLNELYRSFRVGDVLTLANDKLLAERLTGAEAGVQLTSFDQRMSLRGTYFWSELTRPVANITLNVQPTLIARQRQNLGRTRSRGLELALDLDLSHHWIVSGGYQFAEATVRSFPANTTLEGLLIPQVPRHQFTLQARYANPSLITLGIQARGASNQFDDDQNRFPLEKYFTLDALVSRRITSAVDAFVAAENLFNQRYSIGLTPLRTIGPPLLMRVGFRLRLGSRQ